MRYTILGFQQQKLIEANLDVVDALVLRQIKDMYSTSTMEFVEEDGVRYMWINYTYLLDQLPIVGTKRNLMRRIEKYGNELYIIRILKHTKNGQKGNYSYIAPTEKLDQLQDFDLMTKSHKGYDKNDIRVMTKSHNKDNTIIDNSIKDNIKTIVEYLNTATGKSFKPSTAKTISCINARIKEGFTVDDFKKVIDIKVADWSNDGYWSNYLRPETLFGNKFEGYLNQGGVKTGSTKPTNQGAGDYSEIESL